MMISPTIDLTDMLSPERVVLLKGHKKHEVLNELVDVMGASKEVEDIDDIRAQIFAREELMSTGIGMGIAVPHVRSAHVNDLVMAVGISSRVIDDYESLDGDPVHLVCMIAAGQGQHTQYIQTLAKVSKQLSNRDLFRKIIAVEDADEAYNLLINQAG